jgi:hypothetical protein
MFVVSNFQKIQNFVSICCHWLTILSNLKLKFTIYLKHLTTVILYYMKKFTLLSSNTRQTLAGNVVNCRQFNTEMLVYLLKQLALLIIK